MLKTEKIEYFTGSEAFKGHYTFDTTWSGKKPAVLIAHDWSGVTPFVIEKTKKLAQVGYLGFAMDMYGEGKTGQTKEEKTALMMPLINDRSLVLNRVTSALKTLRAMAQVDPERIAIMGYCFGGLCALDLARSAQKIKGAISFHGNLTAPGISNNEVIQSKILALHGYADPLVPKEQLLAFEQEMTLRKADWQIHMYGDAMHSFTNPEANDPDFGTVYNAKADIRSWQALLNFLAEIFK